MADRSEEIIAIGGVISVQILNEFALGRLAQVRHESWSEIRDVLIPSARYARPEPVTVETHELGLEIAERYRLSFYDATIVASALRAGCETLYSEDLQDGQIINKQVTIRNPFASL